MSDKTKTVDDVEASLDSEATPLTDVATPYSYDQLANLPQLNGKVIGGDNKAEYYNLIDDDKFIELKNQLNAGYFVVGKAKKASKLESVLKIIANGNSYTFDGSSDTTIAIPILSNYNNLTGLPKINGVTLSGDKTLDTFDIASANEVSKAIGDIQSGNKQVGNAKHADLAARLYHTFNLNGFTFDGSKDVYVTIKDIIETSGIINVDDKTIGYQSDNKTIEVKDDGITFNKISDDAIAYSIRGTDGASPLKLATEKAVRDAIGGSTASKIKISELSKAQHIYQFSLLDENDKVVSSDTLDLPLELLKIVSLSYDNDHEEFVMVWQDADGEEHTMKIPASGILKGVVTETATQDISNKTITNSKIDAKDNELNSIIEVSSLPATNIKNNIYYNTTDAKYYLYKGGEWSCINNDEVQTDGFTVKTDDNNILYATGDFTKGSHNNTNLKANGINIVNGDSDLLKFNSIDKFITNDNGEKIIDISNNNVSYNGTNNFRLANLDFSQLGGYSISYPSSTSSYSSLMSATALELNKYELSNFTILYNKAATEYSVNDKEIVNVSKLNEGLNLKQDITDNNLTTIAKTIVGAINENKKMIDTLTGQFVVKVVDTKPDVPSNRTIYFVGTEDTYYDIWLYNENTWYKLGTFDIDLDDYYKKDYIDDSLVHSVDITQSNTNITLTYKNKTGTALGTSSLPLTTTITNTTSIPTSGAVYNELIKSGSFELVEGTASDSLKFKLTNNSDRDVMNATVDFGDKLVLKDKIQTLTNKTIDIEGSLDSGNIIKNIPVESFADRPLTDAGKALVVNSEGKWTFDEAASKADDKTIKKDATDKVTLYVNLDKESLSYSEDHKAIEVNTDTTNSTTEIDNTNHYLVSNAIIEKTALPSSDISDKNLYRTSTGLSTYNSDHWETMRTNYNTPQIVGRVENGDASLPEKRPDGSPLQDFDECIVAAGQATPFTIGTFTVTSIADKFVYNKSKGVWQIYCVSYNAIDICYPVGSIYVQMPGDLTPASRFPNTTWSDVSSSYNNRYFMASSSVAVGTYQNQELPNIYGNVGSMLIDEAKTASGAFYFSGTPRSRDWSGQSGDSIRALAFKASNSNSIYNGSTVKPYTVTIKMWKRTA